LKITFLYLFAGLFLTLMKPVYAVDCEDLKVICGGDKRGLIYRPNECDAQGWPINRENIVIDPVLDSRKCLLKTVRVKVKYIPPRECGYTLGRIPYEPGERGVRLILTKKGTLGVDDVGRFPEECSLKGLKMAPPEAILKEWALRRLSRGPVRDEIIFETDLKEAVSLSKGESYELEVVLRPIESDYATGRARKELVTPCR